MEDEIVEEVRRVREAYAAQFGYDIRKMVEDLRRHSDEAGRQTVSLPPKPVDPQASKKVG